jgi:hypothetical protein
MIGFKIINLDCVIGRRGIPIQLPPSILAKLIISKPVNCGLGWRNGSIKEKMDVS